MRSLLSALTLTLVGALALAACGDDALTLPVAANCNPLGFDHCMAPWPSAAFEVADTSTATGRKLAIPEGALLTNANRFVTDPAPWNKADGFSASAPMVMNFPTGVDPAPLADPTEIEQSLTDASPTIIVDLTTGERVAHFAEVDVPAAATPGRQALYLRPVARLSAGHRYAVGIKDSLHAKDGSALPVPAGFAALRDGTTTTHPLLEAMRPRFGDVLTALAANGAPADQLVVAWDFTVASDEFVRRLPTAARDKALAELDREPSTVRIENDVMVDDGRVIRRRIDGFLTAPLFLTNDGEYLAGTTLALGADGLPELKGRYEIPFTAIIPTCAYGEGHPPVGIMMYGHGLNGTGEQAASGTLRDTAAAICVISVGTDMRGMSEPDIGNIARALTDLNHADEVMETLVQGLANHVTLGRAMETVLANQVFVCRPEDSATGCTVGRSLADPGKLYYYGLSQGHIFGTAIMTYVPNIKRGVLGVGGGGYALMLERSSDWPTYRQILQGAYPDPLDVVMAINLFQQRWDQTETSGIANVVLHGIPGTPAKQLLLHMAIGDDQVPNLSTEWQARSMGIPVIMPASVKVPWGLQMQDAPIALGSGIVIMDGGAPPVPITNVPAPETGMHNLTRSQAASRRQIGIFFATGEIRNECDGACHCAEGKCD
jgi:hypothetical protein